MTFDREEQAADLLFDLLEVEAEERRRRCEELRASDPSMARRVEQLLAAESGADSWLGSRMAAPRSEQPNDFGPYKITRKLGEGGFASVWLAEQSQPVKRKLALKVLKGAHHGEVSTRFLAERQALARMDHPGIAKVFDGGELEDGRPWFAMEWVDGFHLTDNSVLNDLELEDRLRVFLQVVRAIQHAHQKGILHRDLKPSNVLVERSEQGWRAKIIDFGIAKALEEPLVDQTLQTRAGQVVGTPAYLAPEQLDGRDLDTRTDLYALGALLYELLAGRPPFAPEHLLEQGWTGLLRTVREKVPSAPSENCSAADYGCSARELKGDLDWIVLRCLEKDPERRYPSVAVLAEEIERYFSGQPVLAGPPEFSYRAGKFIRRHRAALATASLSFVALLGLTAYSLRQAHETRIEAGRYGEIAEFLESIFHGLDPAVSRGKDTELIQSLLQEAELALEEDQAMLPEVRATLHRALGGAYRGIGQTEKAEGHWQAALEIRERVLSKNSEDLLHSLDDLGALYFERKRIDEAEPLFQRAYLGWQARAGADDARSRRAWSRLAFIARERGDGEESARILEQVVAAERDAHGGELAAESIIYLNGLAYAYSETRDFERSLELYQEALHLQLRDRDETHPQVLSALSNLSSILLELDRPQDAAPLIERAVAGKRAILQPGHPDLVPALNNLAQVQMRADDFEGAEAAIVEGISIATEHDGPSGFRTLGMQLQLALVYDKSGLDLQAVEVLQESLPLAGPALSADHFLVNSMTAQLGHSLRKLGRFAEAEPYARLAAEAASRVYADDHPARVLFPVRWGLSLEGLQRDAEARQVLEAHAEQLLAMSRFATDGGDLCAAMARVETRAGNKEEAQAWEARAIRN